MHPVLDFLDALAGRLAQDVDALALLALGSAGRHTERLDEHSDADFFVITVDKARFLSDLGWLGQPQRWVHRNTADGYQALVGSVFCEFAVFEPSELPGVPYAAGRVVWAREGFDTVLRTADPTPPDHEWLRREILSNLYVGLHRWLRGERLAAQRMVQGEAVDNLLRLLGSDDPFVPARRAEQRKDLPLRELVGGYDATPRSARTVLHLLGADDDPMRDEVLTLLARLPVAESG
jgi:hypothetical protein